eukprot:11159857-Lingulodinium_polyedra.AAC.1
MHPTRNECNRGPHGRPSLPHPRTLHYRARAALDPAPAEAGALCVLSPGSPPPRWPQDAPKTGRGP